MVKKQKVMIALLMMAAISGSSGNISVHAAAPKISVDQVYQNATRIKGKAKKKSIVKIKIGKKTYQAKVSKSGKYSIKVPKVKKGVKYTINGYLKKKVYAKKNFYAVVKGIEVVPFTEKDHIFSGYTAQKAHVILKCNGKSYTTTSSNSGHFTIDTKKSLGRNKVEIKVYKKGKMIAKYWKEYQDNTSQNTNQNAEQNKNDQTNNQVSAHEHLYNIPVYKTVHVEESGHWETITTSGSYVDKEVMHDICLTCKKDLTQEYVDGIKDGRYKKIKIPASGKATSSKKSRDILEPYYGVQWQDDMPLYEDFVAYGGWDHTCTNHKLYEQEETINEYFPGAIYKKWIIDQKECDKNVVVGYQCSCGEIKSVDTTETEHQHLYNIPIYKTVHMDEAKHLEKITIPGTTQSRTEIHDECSECQKDLTKEYVSGIKNGAYRNIKIPSSKNATSEKSKELLQAHNIKWDDSYPLYEDYLAYGGWNHTCAGHKLKETSVFYMYETKDETISRWVIDQAAHGEQEITGFRCSCGSVYKLPLS